MADRFDLNPTPYLPVQSVCFLSDSDIALVDRLTARRFRDFEQEIRHFRHGRPGTARRHALTARAWLNGDSARALALYGAILADWPHDVLALAVAHALDFHLGRRRVMRDRIAKVLPHWTAKMPGYPSVLAMYAFVLEENGQYRRAEKVARRALALDPGHPGAIHVVAHVMEMQGRVHDGLAFLAAVESAWGEGTGLSVHPAWHRALFHLDANDPEGALAIYDARIATASRSDMSALADGSALLWRFQLQNIDVGERWRLLADRWAMHNLADARAFYVVHAMMAFIAAGRPAAALRLAEALRSTKKASSLPPEDTRGAAVRSSACLRPQRLCDMRGIA